MATGIRGPVARTPPQPDLANVPLNEFPSTGRRVGKVGAAAAHPTQTTTPTQRKSKEDKAHADAAGLNLVAPVQIISDAAIAITEKVRSVKVHDGREARRKSHREAQARKEAKARASPDTDPRRRAPGKEEDPKSERFVQKIARSVEGAGNDASDKSEAD
jgi:hypothetical protein